MKMSVLQPAETMNTNDTSNSIQSSLEKQPSFKLIRLQKCDSLHEADFAEVCPETQVSISLK